MLISLFLVRLLHERLLEQGASDEAFLRAVGLSAQELLEPHRFVDFDRALRAGHAAYEASGDPALALHLGNGTLPHTLGVLGALFAHCNTLRGVIAELRRYLPLLFSTGSVSLREAGELASLSLDLPAEVGRAERFVVEYAFASMFRVARQFVGPRAVPHEVRLPYPAPAYAAEYEAIFGCAARFDAERAELVFSSKYLDQRQPFADERLYTMIKLRAESLLCSDAHAVPVHQRVHVLLKENLSMFDSGTQAVASRLGLSARALRRRLFAEGTSLSELAEEARRELAQYLLADTNEPLKEIADRLRYSEPSAFFRAFKRWTGETPSHYRLRHQRAHSQAS